MARSILKSWVAGEVLLAGDLVTEFNNIYQNGLSIINPLTGTLTTNGNTITLDVDDDTSIDAGRADDVIDLALQNVDLFRFDGSVGSVQNGLTFTASAANNAVQIAPISGGSNISLNYVNDGTGQFQVDGENIFESDEMILSSQVFGS